MPRIEQRAAERQRSLEGVEGTGLSFDDPQVAAFARAYSRIKDPEKRAFVEWFVNALADEE